MALATIETANGVIEVPTEYALGIQAGEDTLREKIVVALANHIEAERKGAEERFGVALEPDTYADDFTFTMSDLEKIING